MPNRILKESICTSDSIDSLTWFEECLFYRMIVNCDDFGRFDGRIAVIKNRLFPLKENLTLKTVSDAINNLARAGLVMPYECDGKPFLYLPSWNEHQNVRAKRSKYPEPDNVNTYDCKCMHMNANVPDIQSNPNPIRNPNPIKNIYCAPERDGVVFVPLNSDMSETNSNSSATNYDMSATNDTVVKGSVVNSIYIAHSDESRDTESLDQFYESIWKLYPVKKGKGQVSKTKKKVLQRIGYEHIKRCIDRFVADMEDSNRDKKYWMHGSTFFNGGYVDYLDENFTNDVKKNIAVPEEQQDEEEIVGDDWWKY